MVPAVVPTPPLVAAAPRNSGSPVLPSTVPAAPAGPTVQTGGLWASLKALFSKKAA
ncbi:hypothetical protein SAMN02799625_05913 [Methylobacterium sp. UNC300MFChir4.1]|uniref:hypothetical protein n=1 Tax=Methylobacterium sp. UNC300MFChir4.1 TaxID=1502747 RepID=UPI0008B3C0CD|nr:hypothetical protein [Methylobacterium sp. UNC300MFChir4.1]SEP39576.1 hypothetical protein SAMN02799625_05913 [Methylobacterium sp. UNC300MFChir4.1]